MTLQPITRNFDDNSRDAGFQFTFYCDVCRDGFKTNFVASRTHKKAGLLRGLGTAIYVAGNTVLPSSNLGWGGSAGANALAQKFQGMSPEWHKEHEAAFQVGQNEAMGHFQRCPKCRKWVCETDWNEQNGLCVEDAPRAAAEVAAAKAQKMVQDIKDKASQTQVFTGNIESKQTICPQCGKPAGEGKFCNNCGATVGLLKCQKCGAQTQVGTKFCGECGNKFE